MLNRFLLQFRHKQFDLHSYQPKANIENGRH